MNYTQYILTTTICLSIFYIAFRLVFKNETNFNQLRIYLLASILISFIIPLFNISINIDFIKNIFISETKPPILPINKIGNVNYSNATGVVAPQQIDWWLTTKYIYFVTTAILLLRIVFQTCLIVILYYKSERIILNNFTLIYSKKKNAFSFFHWIFINKNIASSEELKHIISHEKIHALQYHSIDLILVELLAAVMWFNPLIWMMKRSMQLVHEYLADEGALGTGIDRLKYQALLVNQVAEEKFVCLSSRFNHSLIKKRMIMMTKSKFNQRTKLKILTLLPVSTIALIFAASINGAFAVPKESSTIPNTSFINRNYTAPDTINANKIIITKQDSSNTTYTISIKSGDTADSKIVYVSKNGENDNLASPSKGVDLSANELVVITNNSSNNQKDSSTNKIHSNLLYIIDGTKVSIDTLKNMDPKSIKQTSLYIIDNSIKKDTIKNYDGVLVITTNNETIPSNSLYIVDGIKQIDSDAIKSINPNAIEKIEVIKKESEIKKYTDQNYDSVIIITTKKGKD